ncbi:MAG: hypothetical protein H0W72_02070 [Planctomycetes bacterium]|nr:hypothetical protein [Planctomycetota bacterium]
MKPSHVLIAVVVLILAIAIGVVVARGTGGETAAAPSSPMAPPPPRDLALAPPPKPRMQGTTHTSSVPGGEVVTKRVPGPDGMAAFAVTVRPVAGITKVDGWIGTTYSHRLVEVTAVRDATSGMFRLEVPAAAAAGTYLWVRVTREDGSVVEVGGEDLPTLP